MARALLTNMRWRPSHLSINLPNIWKATWVKMKPTMWKMILKRKPGQSYQTQSQTWHLPGTLNEKRCCPRIAWIWSSKTRNMSSSVSSSHNMVSQLMFTEWLPGHWDFQGLAKGASYPGSRCTPPWAKLAESPNWFFAHEDLPKVDYDNSQKKVILQDPSRMKNHELNACLRLWQDCQMENMTSFQFHHWWNEGQKEFIAAHKPEPFDSDADNDGDLSENSEDRGEGQSRKQCGKEKPLGKTRKQKNRSVAQDGRSKRDKWEKHRMNGNASIAKKEQKKKHKKMVDYSLSIREGHGDDLGESPPEKARNPVVTGLISQETYRDDSVWDNISSEHEQTGVRIFLLRWRL